MNSLRIVLLGKTGAGKSSCGNTIMNEELFHASISPSSVTRKCESKKKSIRGKEIKVVDTPGFFDTDLSEKEVNSEILQCITECAPGPHAFLIVLKVDKYTEQEKEIVRKITASFGEEALKHTVVLFTHGDQLSENQTIEDFVGQSTELQQFVNKCGGRVHVIDNKYWNQQQEGYKSNRVQVENLLNTIEEMVRENGGQCYTNEMLQAVDREIEQECESLRLLGNNEPLDMAKQTVHTRLCVRFAGVATGTLLGAFLGVVGALAAVLKTFPPMKMPSKVTLATSAIAGGVMGGIIGYKAAEGADTMTDAVKSAAKETLETAKNVPQNVKTAINKQKY